MRPRQFRYMEFRNVLKELVLLGDPDVYVEIGVQKAETFNLVAPGARRAIAVDINPMPQVIRNPNVEVFHMSSLEFAEVWQGKIDILFIDGDHRREAVRQDILALEKFVPECTGLILLHDTYPVVPDLEKDSYCSNAWEVAREIHEDWEGWEIVTIPGPWAGLSILRKAPRHLAWK
jgi:hypothetical protein